MSITTRQILNISSSDFNKLSERELRKYVQTLANTANKRISTLRSSGLSSPALSYIESGGKISTRGKKLNELRSEYMRAKGFLESKTGSVRGARGVMNSTIQMLGARGVNINQSQYNDFWKAYERLKAAEPSVANKGMNYRVWGEIAEALHDTDDIEKIVENIYNNLEIIYEENEEDDNLWTLLED